MNRRQYDLYLEPNRKGTLMEETWNVACPYCGESVCLLVDVSAGNQRYVEDCQVCCRPIDLHVRIEDGEIQYIESKRSDE